MILNKRNIVLQIKQVENFLRDGLQVQTYRYQSDNKKVHFYDRVQEFPDLNYFDYEKCRSNSRRKSF